MEAAFPETGSLTLIKNVLLLVRVPLVTLALREPAEPLVLL